MSVLITGGAGFIGSHITEKLVEKGFDVTIIDDLSSGRKENIQSFENNVELIHGSILDLRTFEKLSKRKFEVIFHVAAVPSVSRSIENPRNSHEANINGTFNILEYCRINKVKRLIYSASSSAYGHQTEEWKKESQPSFPISPYALQKYVGEKYCEYYHKFFNIETIALRYFNVFGPRQNPNSPYSAVIPAFIKATLNGKSMVIHGDGLQSRDFTYVDNVVQANINAMEIQNADAFGNVFNVALGDNTNLIQLADIISRLLKVKKYVEFKEARLGDIKHSKADIAKAKQILGYVPKIALEEGLLRTIEYIKNYEN